MQDDLTPVYDAGSLLEVELVRERLELEGIEVFADNQQSPFDGLTAADQTHVLLVLPEHADRARALITLYEQEKRSEQ